MFQHREGVGGCTMRSLFRLVVCRRTRSLLFLCRIVFLCLCPYHSCVFEVVEGVAGVGVVWWVTPAADVFAVCGEEDAGFSAFVAGVVFFHS